MTCQGNVIRCYFDGELVITATDNYNSAGYPGVKASGYVTKFDDFKVGEIIEDEVLDLPEPEQNQTNTSPLTGVVNYIAPICFVISLLGLVVVAVFAIINRKKIFN